MAERVCRSCGVVGDGPRQRKVDAEEGGRGAASAVLCGPCWDQYRAERDRVQVGRLVDVVASVEPAMDRSVIERCITEAASTLRDRTLLERTVTGDPQVLCRGGSDAPAQVDGVVALLIDVGAVNVRLPTCVLCGRSEWLKSRLNGQRCCRACATRSRTGVCSSCGVVKTVARHGGAEPTCSTCWNRNGRRREVCSGCGKLRVPARRNDDGSGSCDACSRRLNKVACSSCGLVRSAVTGSLAGLPLCAGCGSHREACGSCGKSARVSARWAGRAWCPTCYERALLAKAECSRCGQTRRPDPRVDGEAICAGCAGLDPFQVCARCGDETRIYRGGRCRRCSALGRFDDLTGASPGPLPIELVRLRSALEASESPKALLRWLERPATRRLLGDVAAGRSDLTHATLDALDQTNAISYLRAALVAVGALPERDEHLIRLEHWINAAVSRIDPVEDRQIIDAFARWWVMRRFRQRTSRATTTTIKSRRKLIAAAIGLLAWLRSEGLDLATVPQHRIDAYAAAASPGRRRDLHDFLRWAHRQHLTTATVTRHNGAPTPHPPAADTAERVRLIEVLVSDDTLSLVDRVAGLLVMLYAQPLSRIRLLTTAHVAADSDGATTLELGTDPVTLPEPLGHLVRRLVDERTGHAILADLSQHPWLFPGGLSGQPLSADTLGARLRRIAVQSRTARTAAMADLASDNPVCVLADLLGIHPNTASRWIQTHSGQWTRYVATRTSATPTRPPR